MRVNNFDKRDSQHVNAHFEDTNILQDETISMSFFEDLLIGKRLFEIGHAGFELFLGRIKKNTTFTCTNNTF